MGQIKNIKLHIVTDIKACRNIYKTFSWQHLTRFSSTKAAKKGKKAAKPAEASYAISLERVNEINSSPSGWAPPAYPPPTLPFHITRTNTNRVPVFIKEKQGNLFTVVTKVRGDENELEKYLRSRLGDDKIYHTDPFTKHVKVEGQHRQDIVKYVQELGF